MENSVLEPLVIRIMNCFETDSKFLFPGICIKNYANILMPFSLKIFFSIDFVNLFATKGAVFYYAERKSGMKSLQRV